MKNFETPKMMIVTFETEDVIVTSGTSSSGVGGDNEMPEVTD